MLAHTKNEAQLSAAYFVPQRDGSLRDYLERCGDEHREGLFLGPEHYHALWDAGLLEPEISTIRIMYNFGRGDEHYTVQDRDSVIGLEGIAHGGKPGTHQIAEVIPELGFMFEVHMWKRTALPQQPALRSAYSGNALEIRLPLTADLWEELYALRNSELAETQAQARRLMSEHDSVRIDRAEAACGPDLNNFYALYRNLTESWTPNLAAVFYRCCHPGKAETRVTGQEMIEIVRSAVVEAGLDPATLYSDLRAAEWRSDGQRAIYSKLIAAYVCLREQGFDDTELIR